MTNLTAEAPAQAKIDSLEVIEHGWGAEYRSTAKRRNALIQRHRKSRLVRVELLTFAGTDQGGAPYFHTLRGSEMATARQAEQICSDWCTHGRMPDWFDRH